MAFDFSKLFENIILPGYCVGCGVCVGMCGHNTISMRWNSLGQYEPYYINQSTCTSCGLCVKVCPFLSDNANENEIGRLKFSDLSAIKHLPETGYFLECYVGHADSQTRLNGASGGTVSQILKWMLNNKSVEKIITVESTGDSNKFFKMAVIDTIDQVNSCSKSVYYPVELSDVIRKIKKNDCRFAIVGLPCFIKAVELSKKLSPLLKKRIVYTLGLTCGQTKSKRYTEYLIHSMNIPLSSVTSISYRRKVKGFPSNNYAFEVTTKDGKILQKMWSEIAIIWCNDLFKQQSCNCCDDIFAECADITFMDAWLPDYTEYEGASLIINRNPLFTSFFNSQSNNYSVISENRIIESQKAVIDDKRLFRNIIDKQNSGKNKYIPVKRSFVSLHSSSKNENRNKLKKMKLQKRSEGTSFTNINKIVKGLNRKSFKQIRRELLKKIGIKKYA